MNILYDHVIRESEGYYKLRPEYIKHLGDYYKDEYYQDSHSQYTSSYSSEELDYYMNLAKEKDFIFQKLYPNKNGKLLDLGCGEGYFLHNISKLGGYEILGIDFNKWAVEHHNPEIADKVIQGDLYAIIDDLIQKEGLFDYINADNVLEHVEDAEFFFQKLQKICHNETLISIRVPNDFSVLQKKLFEMGKIDSDFWVTTETGEHNYYFTVSSLVKLGEKMGYEAIESYSDFPIDFFLMNENTNYVKDKSTGHNCHVARVNIENLLFEQSLEGTFNLHKSYAELGVGRDIVVIFRRL